MGHLLDTVTYRPLGILESCFKEKFGVPRQPNLITRAPARLKLPLSQKDLIRGLEESSHVWLIFHFHQGARGGAGQTVRPPRLGGKERLGALATRSPHRPNAIGLSAVELSAIRTAGRFLILDFVRTDLVDGTPILDIKPYVPYTDALRTARSPWTKPKRSESLRVSFSPAAKEALRTRSSSEAAMGTDLVRFAREVLSQDPRPAHQRHSSGEYAAKFFDFDLHWSITAAGDCRVEKVN